jgi:L-cystine uptake protein TcyP (sodium:dicarboxylate symporter family)
MDFKKPFIVLAVLLPILIAAIIILSIFLGIETHKHRHNHETSAKKYESNICVSKACISAGNYDH